LFPDELFDDLFEASGRRSVDHVDPLGGARPA